MANTHLCQWRDGVAAVTWPHLYRVRTTIQSTHLLTSSGYFWQREWRSWSFWWWVKSDFGCTTICWHWIHTLLGTQWQWQPRMSCPTVVAKAVFCCIEETGRTIVIIRCGNQPCHVNLCAYEHWIFLTTQLEEMTIWWVESEEYTSKKANSCKICTLLYRIHDHVRRGIQFGLPMIDIALRHGQQQLNLQSLEECDFKQLVAFHSYWVALHGAKIMLYCKRRLVFEFRWTPPALLPI